MDINEFNDDYLIKVSYLKKVKKLFFWLFAH